MPNQKNTRQTYNRIAEDYAVLNNTNTEVVPLQIKFKELLPQGTVYDLGCGTGRDTKALQELGYDVTGLDYSEGMLEVARREYPDCQFKRVDMLTELETLERVDGIWACASLLHFSGDEFEEVLGEIKNLVRSGGVIYNSLKLSDNLTEEVVGGRYFKYYSEEVLKRIFNHYDLEILYQRNNGNEERRTFGNYILKNIEVPEGKY